MNKTPEMIKFFLVISMFSRNGGEEGWGEMLGGRVKWKGMTMGSTGDARMTSVDDG